MKQGVSTPANSLHFPIAKHPQDARSLAPIFSLRESGGGRRSSAVVPRARRVLRGFRSSIMRSLSFAALGLAAVCACAPLAHAVDFQFDGQHIDVPYITGSGSSKAMLVLDFGPGSIYQFGYQWDGSPRTDAQMLDDIAAAGAVDVTSSNPGTPGEYVTGISYSGAGYLYPGSDPFASDVYPAHWFYTFSSANPDFWTPLDDGAGETPLNNGDWNLWAYEQTDFPGDNVPIAIPEPASLALLALGGMTLLNCRVRVRRTGFRL
jgi:hypothetical protein